MMRASPAATLAAVALAVAASLAAAARVEKSHSLKSLTPDERRAYLRRAQIWHPVDVPSMDVRRGPEEA